MQKLSDTNWLVLLLFYLLGVGCLFWVDTHVNNKVKSENSQISISKNMDIVLQRGTEGFILLFGNSSNIPCNHKHRRVEQTLCGIKTHCFRHFLFLLSQNRLDYFINTPSGLKICTIWCKIMLRLEALCNIMLHRLSDMA